MRSIFAAALAATLVVSPVLAAETSEAGLAPGKPAGVQKAQLEAGGILLWLGILGAAGAIAAIASTTQGSTSAPASTAP